MGFPKGGRASPLVKVGVNTLAAKWVRLMVQANLTDRTSFCKSFNTNSLASEEKKA